MRLIDADAMYERAQADSHRGTLEDWEFDAIINYLDSAPTVGVVLVQGQLICDPLSADKPEAIGPEVRRKARAVLMEELEAKGLIRYQMLNGVLYAGIRAAAPEDKT